MDVGAMLARMLQIGIVTNVDGDKKKVRVKFRDTGIISDWLSVLQITGAEVYIPPDGGHTHEISDTYTGGGSAAAVDDHDHSPGAKVTGWLPKVNDRVLVLYLPVEDGDGFVIGGF